MFNIKYCYRLRCCWGRWKIEPWLLPFARREPVTI